jgi:hypothetical protein
VVRTPTHINLYQLTISLRVKYVTFNYFNHYTHFRCLYRQLFMNCLTFDVKAVIGLF